MIQRNKNLPILICFAYFSFLALRKSLYLETLIKCILFICCSLLLDSGTSWCSMRVCVCVFWWEPLCYCRNKHYTAKHHQTVSSGNSCPRVYQDRLTGKSGLAYIIVKWTLGWYIVLMGLELAVRERGRLGVGAGIGVAKGLGAAINFQGGPFESLHCALLKQKASLPSPML